MLLSTTNNILDISEVTIGFETKLDNNASRKYGKYHYLELELRSKYHKVKFVKISIRSLGIFEQTGDTFVQMCYDLDFDKNTLTMLS